MSEDNVEPIIPNDKPFIRKAIPLVFPVTSRMKYEDQAVLRKMNENNKTFFEDQIIHLVTSTEQCQWSMNELKLYIPIGFFFLLFSFVFSNGFLFNFPTFRHCNEYGVLGLDCEWTCHPKGRQPIQLLQLATHRGLCVLIRLPYLKTIPSELQVTFITIAKTDRIEILKFQFN